MKYFLTLLFVTFYISTCYSKTTKVGQGGEYSNLSQAANFALPGDTLLLLEGTYHGGAYIENLQGTADAYITIMAESEDAVLFQGGTSGIQMTGPAYVRFEGLNFEGQTGNGVNIDDGGTYETPAHHIIIENCKWLVMGVDGNNDELKMSGVDNFEVRNCIFKDGATGGSLIDMVGCHDGIIEKCSFSNGGSNSIQAKGGTADIIIRRNRFENGGLRAVNIGGSTGMQFFRPSGANAESSNILVHSNIFIGGQTPFAFVGTVHSKVVNNTIITPGKWAFRILQENNDASLEKCAFNEVVNNIFYFDENISFSEVNIGPNTRAETFTFSNNLWYKDSNEEWEGANLPAEETGGIIDVEPGFIQYPDDLRLSEGSLARGNGRNYTPAKLDFAGNSFKLPRSIGAYEYYGIDNIIENETGSVIGLYPNPASDFIFLSYAGKASNLGIINTEGKIVIDVNKSLIRQLNTGSAIKINITELEQGCYYLISDKNRIKMFVVER